MVYHNHVHSCHSYDNHFNKDPELIILNIIEHLLYYKHTATKGVVKKDKFYKLAIIESIMANIYYIIGGIVIFIFFAGLRIVNQYERAVKFRLGRYVKTLQPGLRWVIPLIERIKKVDIRVITTDIPAQEVITKDNVPMKVNGVVFFKVINSEKAILEVEEYKYAISQLAQSALRDMTGKAELDSVLAKREEIGNQIQKIVDKETDPWGIKVTDVKIKDIELPENMKRAMAHQAEAERDRRARIINAEAEKQAAQKLKEAGDILSKSPSSMKLRFYQTLNDISEEKNSTIVLPFPEEIIDLMTKNSKKKKE